MVILSGKSGMLSWYATCSMQDHHATPDFSKPWIIKPYCIIQTLSNLQTPTKSGLPVSFSSSIYSILPPNLDYFHPLYHSNSIPFPDSILIWTIIHPFSIQIPALDQKWKGFILRHKMYFRLERIHGIISTSWTIRLHDLITVSA